MKGHVGDRLVLEGQHVGEARRIGTIVAVPHRDGTPPFSVRWLDSERETLVFPGPDAHLEPPPER
ncbi:MAG TPA: DUF1918 domain-containing protein [Rugosimonospora sp.]|nr:DUF1918 domain-containing protein [Rugosimonospora sp.]